MCFTWGFSVLCLNCYFKAIKLWHADQYQDRTHTHKRFSNTCFILCNRALKVIEQCHAYESLVYLWSMVIAPHGPATFLCHLARWLCWLTEYVLFGPCIEFCQGLCCCLLYWYISLGPFTCHSSATFHIGNWINNVQSVGDTLVWEPFLEYLLYE